MRFTVNGDAVDFAAADVKGINVQLYYGNNSLNVSVDLPVFVQGGQKNDSITTAGGNDSIFANSGSDVVNLGDGDDLLSTSGKSRRQPPRTPSLVEMERRTSASTAEARRSRWVTAILRSTSIRHR